MLVKASIVVMSHLSDLQIETTMNVQDNVQNRLGFIKYVIHHCNSDLNKEINADALYDEYLKKQD